jgi:uncharacterized membrane protein YraQ (UPF0718 family)
MLGFFGWKITAAYVASGMLIGIVTGLILGRMRLEKYLAQDIVSPDMDIPVNGEKSRSLGERAAFGLKEAVTIVRKLWLWVLAGVALGAVIHNYIPQEAIQTISAKTGIFSVPLAVLLGVPMYGGCAAILPVAIALFQKGFPLGTALAFMMAVSALSLPEAVLLRRAMKLQLIVLFFGITTLAIIITGYLFNILQAVLV